MSDSFVDENQMLHPQESPNRTNIESILSFFYASRRSSPSKDETSDMQRMVISTRQNFSIHIFETVKFRTSERSFRARFFLSCRVRSHNSGELIEAFHGGLDGREGWFRSEGYDIDIFKSDYGFVVDVVDFVVGATLATSAMTENLFLY